MDNKIIRTNKIKCRKCGDIIESTSVHLFLLIIIPAGKLLTWISHFHCPRLQKFVLDMGYTLEGPKIITIVTH